MAGARQLAQAVWAGSCPARTVPGSAIQQMSKPSPAYNEGSVMITGRAIAHARIA